MEFDGERIRLAIEHALIADLEFDSAVARDIAFHMTDWLQDLGAFTEFCVAPDSLEEGQVTDLLMGFVAHVPNHVAAARKLLMDEPLGDIFGLEILEG